MAFRLLIAAMLLGAVTAAAVPGGDPLRPAREYLARADTASAIHSLRGSYKRCPDSSGYILLAQVYRERGTIKDRLRSQQVLEDARARFPDDNAVRLELGRTYYAQGLFGDAMILFNDVLRTDPRNCDAHYLIGLYNFNNWKRVNDFRDNLRAARRELRAAARCDTSNADAAFKFLIAGYVLGDTSSVDATRMMRRFPDHGEFAMFRGALDFDARRLEDCRRDFSAGLAALDEETREAYAGVARIMTGTERRRYQAADADSLARAYWLMRDPDPTTDINEPALEHVYRMFLTDAMYSPARAARPGWERRVHGYDTDRGEAFLKFGRPMTINYSLGDDPDTGYLEVWSYVVDGVFQQFLFVDEFLNGNPRIPVSAGITMQYLRESPRRTDFAPRARAVPGIMDVVAFRDDGLAASVYIAMMVDADSLRAAALSEHPSHFNLRTAWFDSMWRRGGGSSEQLDARVLSMRSSGGRECYLVARRVRTPFEGMHVACAFEDARGNARALVVADGDASRFMEDGLVLSDILLTTGPQPGAASASLIRRGGLLWPRVDRSYGPGEKIEPYVEVYNLARTAQSTDYDITYAIYPGEKDDDTIWSRWGKAMAAQFGFRGDPAIAQTFHRRGSLHDDYDSIRIDVSRLRPGPYRLVVAVADNLSGRYAETQTTFRKEATSAAGRE